MENLPLPLPVVHNPRQLRLQWLLVCVLVGVAALESPGAYRALKLWRAHLFIAEAEDFIRQQKPNEAFARVQAAFQLAPTSDRVLRLSARLYATIRHPQALTLWRQLVNTPGSSAEDHRNYVELGLTRGMADLVNPVVARWISEKTEHSIELLMIARYFMLQGKPEEAREYASRGARKRPGDEVSQLFSARLLLGSNSSQDARLGLQTLWSLADSPSSVGLQAIELLARRQDLTKDHGDALVNKLSNHPMKTTEDELLIRDLKLRFEPDQFFPVLDETLNRFRNAPQAQQLAVGRWLNKQKSFNKTIELIPLAQSLTNRDAFVLRLDAMAALDKWKQIGGELDAEPNPLDPAIREVFRARVAMELGQPNEARVQWRKVHFEAGQNPQVLKYVAKYAERVGERADAEQAYRRLTTFPDQARDAYVNMVRLANEDLNTKRLRELLREMKAIFPEDPLVENDLAYLNLLQNEAIQDSKATAEKLYDLNPSFLAYRTTLALARLRTREIDKAKKVYEGLTLEWTLAPPGWQAVHAAVHGASGNTAAAREFIEKIPLENLKPEERALIQPWLP